MCRHFLNALSFLTVIVPRRADDAGYSELGRHGWPFPAVGGCIGLILWAAFGFLDAVFDPYVTAVLIVVLWAYLTGGLHLDGWVDCWDALPAPVSPERRLEILKDSRVGTFGAAGLMSLFLVKMFAIASPKFQPMMLLIAPLASRTMILVIAYNAPHLGKGMAAALIESVSARSLLTGVALTVPFLLFGGFQSVIGAVVAFGFSMWFRQFAVNRIHAVNGDVLGAVCELTEAVLLLAACVRF